MKRERGERASEWGERDRGRERQGVKERDAGRGRRIEKRGSFTAVPAPVSACRPLRKVL